MKYNPYSQLGHGEFLRYLAKNDYMIDGHYLAEGVRLHGVADSLESLDTRFIELWERYKHLAKIANELTIEKNARKLILTDSETVVESLNQDTEPNAALKAAAEKYKHGGQEMNEHIIRRLQQQPECSTIANFMQDEINRLTKERDEALKKLSQYSMDKLAQLDEELGLND